MRIAEFLTKERILDEMSASDKTGALEELSEPLLAAFPRLDRGKVLRVLNEREALGSTAMEHGIAMPHGKIADLQAPALVLGRSRAGINFAGDPARPTHLFFLLLAPEGAAGQQLGLLGALARLLKDADFRGRITQATDRNDIWRLFEAL